MAKAKKSFSGGLNSLLGDTKAPEQVQAVAEPKALKKEITKTSQIGTKENETRATFIVKEESQVVDINNLPNGVYLMRTVNGSSRIVIQ